MAGETIGALSSTPSEFAGKGLWIPILQAFPMIHSGFGLMNWPRAVNVVKRSSGSVPAGFV
jgi:hypothetical protein